MPDVADEPRDIGREVSELREQLIEQEHRGLRILTNFFIEKRKWPRGDPRHAAAWKALLYRVWFSPGTIAAAGGAVGAVSAMLLFGQYQEMREQNKRFAEQTLALQGQVELQRNQFVLQRRTELITILYDGNDGEGSISDPPSEHKIPRANARTRSEALIEFIGLEQDRLRKINAEIVADTDIVRIDLRGALLSEISAPKLDLPDARLDYSDLKRANLDGSNLSRSIFAEADLSRAYLNGAILANADFDGAILIRAKLEGAQLSGANLSLADLDGANLIDANLNGAIVDSAHLGGGAKLDDANLSDSYLAGSDFSGARLKRAILDRASLVDADLSYADLTGASLSGADLEHADLTRVRGLSCDRLKHALNWEHSFRDEECGAPIPAKDEEP